MENETMTATEVATMLGITTGALRSKISRGADVPPFIRLKGQRARIWLRETVFKWLKDHETQPPRSTPWD